jgi:hemerythrin
MVNLNWSEEITAGITQIERQHQNLLSLIRDLRGMINNSARSGELISLLIEFSRFVEEHFEYEEEILGLSGYIKSEQHKSEHDSILQKLNEITGSKIEHKLSDIQDSIIAIFNWFEQHLINEDAGYLRYLKDGLTDTSQ